MASCFSGAYLPYDEVLDGYVLLRIPVTVYAGASGDFFFGITIDDLCDADYGEGYVVSDAPLTATLHVEATKESAVIESAYAEDGEAVCEVSAAEPGVVFIAAFDSDGYFLGCFSQQKIRSPSTSRALISWLAFTKPQMITSSRRMDSKVIWQEAYISRSSDAAPPDFRFLIRSSTIRKMMAARPSHRLMANFQVP